ncbi:DUF397 domain-containing protein [Amycolatopsis sp. CA-126428]|uniref:DUF397 domain-containing protein n=1 Tax=Amycolatopsis sp. CA-126428 TaxID=2073158 RepID=UPI001E5690DA|nr:DUF397 domain-containing protein [Amycolatopsis sp. CA-126428]
MTEQVGQPSTETEALTLVWVKSSASGSGNADDCVEVATAAERVHLRDSKFVSPQLIFSREAWKAFLQDHS